MTKAEKLAVQGLYRIAARVVAEALEHQHTGLANAARRAMRETLDIWPGVTAARAAPEPKQKPVNRVRAVGKSKKAKPA